jgi:hypothetical protein
MAAPGSGLAAEILLNPHGVGGRMAQKKESAS